VSRRSLKDGAGSARSTAGEADDREGVTIPMQVDLRVHDDVALDEIELYTDVLAAVAAASDGPLAQSDLDAALGLRAYNR
jgi:hypothetical protein